MKDSIVKRGYDPEYINEFSNALLTGFYLKDGETFDDAIARAAEAFCFGDYNLAQRVYEAAHDGWFMFASPVLSNAPKGRWTGKPTDEEWVQSTNGEISLVDKYWDGEHSRGMAISCFSLVAPDTIDGQIAATGELAALSVAGGGVGIHNKIRATTDKAPGPIPFMKTLDASIGYYKQGVSRRGACAVYMDVNHPDIMEHIKFRVPSGGDSARKSDNRKQFHTAVNVTDDFIDAVLSDSDFDLVCPHSGKVYETVKARHIWEEILETRALTGEPYIFKVDTANRALPQTQKDKGLRVNGSNLCVTGDTKVLTDKGQIEIAKLEDQDVAVWNGEEWSEVTVRKTGTNEHVIKIETSHGQVLECTPMHKFYIYRGVELVQVRAHELKPGDVLEYWDLPEVNLDETSDLDDTVRFLQDIYDRNEVETRYGMGFRVLDTDMAERIQLNAQSLGVKFILDRNDNALYTGGYHFEHLISMGFKTRTPSGPPMDPCNTVTKVIDEGKHEDVYCFNEPKRHRGVFNGILTGQCSEITLPTSDDRTFVCCLSSLVLEKYDEWKDTNVVGDVVRLLDNVIQHFIEESDPSLAKAAFSAIQERAIGLGTMGWHYYLMSKNIPFEGGGFGSAINHTHTIFKNIKDKAVAESSILAIERGEPNDMIGSGRRNSHLLAPAPNSNNSIIAGTSASIEPISGNCYTHTTRAGSFLVKNPHLDKLLHDMAPDDKWVESVWKDILDHQGSVQHLDILNDEQKNLFKTAFEIDQHWVIEQGDARAQYICQSQSLNLFFPAGVDRAYYNSVHLKALKAPYLKSLYYSRMERGVNADVVKKIERQALVDWAGEDCVACSG